MISAIEPKLIAGAVEQMMSSQKSFVGNVLKHISPQILVGVINDIMENNPDFLKNILNHMNVLAVSEQINRSEKELLPFVNALLDEKNLLGMLGIYHRSNLGKTVNRTNVAAATKAISVYKIDYDYTNPIDRNSSKSRRFR